MNDTPNVLRNDFQAALYFLLLTEPVPKRIKKKHTDAEIYVTAAEENITGGGNSKQKYRKKAGIKVVI